LATAALLATTKDRETNTKHTTITRSKGEKAKTNAYRGVLSFGACGGGTKPASSFTVACCVRSFRSFVGVAFLNLQFASEIQTP
jgi:hypothetical protein